jgi:hypothetical protein
MPSLFRPKAGFDRLSLSAVIQADPNPH